MSLTAFDAPGVLSAISNQKGPLDAASY